MSLSRSDIADALFLVDASYASNSNNLINSLATSQWVALGSEELGMSPTDFGIFVDSDFLFDSLNNQAFVARTADTLSINFTGTDFPTSLNSIQDSLADWLTNIGHGSIGWDLVAAYYFELFESAVTYAQQNNISEILLTGHSRGGAIAEYFYVNYVEYVEGLGIDLSGVALASPGVHGFVSGHAYDFISFEEIGDLVVNSTVLDASSVTEIQIDGLSDPPNFLSVHGRDNYFSAIESWLYDSNFYGTSENDDISGSLGFDDIFGFGGNDTIFGAAYDDVINGGAGEDTARYAGTSSSYSFATDFAGNIFVIDNVGLEGIDHTISIEYYAFSDVTLTHEDVLAQIASDTPLPSVPSTTYGGPLTTNLNGGEGHDHITLDYSSGEVLDAYYRTVQPVNRIEFTGLGDNEIAERLGYTRATFSSPTAQFYADININGFETFDITATNGNDAVHTLEGDDVLHGLGGNDDLRGNGGNDTLIGGEGNDALYGGAGINVLDGGDNDDVLNTTSQGDILRGGAGYDRAHFDFNPSDTSLLAGTYDVTNTTTGWVGIEAISGTLGGNDDTVVVTDQHHNLNGGEGHDHITLDYSSGEVLDAYYRTVQPVNRIEFTGLGDNEIAERLGYTRATFSSPTAQFYADININGFETFDITATNGNDAVHTLEGDDVLHGLGGNDDLRGNGGNDTLIGGEGNDALYGGAGINVLDGGDNDDVLNTTSQGDILRGGAGYDRAHFDFNPSDTSLLAGTYDVTNTTTGWVGIEAISGTLGGNDDTVVVTDQHHNLNGGEGHDHITLDYSSGEVLDAYYRTVQPVNRIEFTGLGDNEIAERLGYTRATFSSPTAQFYADININGFETFDITATNGNDAVHTLEGDDVLHGLGGNDDLRGNGGNDTLIGGEGNDALYGGAGDDSTDGGAGNDLIIDGIGADLLTGENGNDVIELLGSTYHTIGYVALNISSDTQIGTQVQISLEGLVRIEAVTDGGADADIVQLSDEGDAFFLHDAYSGFHSSVSLAEDYVGNESVARFANIEEIRGMGGDDIIDLTSPDYSLAGVAMNIDGGEGDDIIWGSDANENISGGNGDDTIFGGIGTDVLTGDLGADVFEFTRTSTDTSVTDFDAGEGDMLRFYDAGGAEFDASSVILTANGITISYTDTASGTDHDISIALATSTVEFTTTLIEIQNALEIT